MRALLLPLVSVVAIVVAALPSGCGTADSASGPLDGEGGSGGEGVCTRIVTDTSVPVAEPPAGATLCAPGVCNYQTQEGCDSSSTCRPQYPAGSSSVVPGCEPAGDGRPGDDCESSADCERGALCVVEARGTTAERSVCRTQCCGGDWSACGAGESCIRQLVIEFADGHTEPAVEYCVPVNTCDPFDPESCSDDPNRECKIVDPTGAVACAPKSDKVLGDECSPPEVCAQGLSCVGGRCVRLCRAEECSEPGCPPGEGACVHFRRNPPGVGECTTNR